MKKVDALQIFYLLYVFVFFWSAFASRGVLSDSKHPNEPTLDIQPTELVSRNVSENDESQETYINLSESNVVPDSEAHPNNVIEPAPTEVLREVPETVFTEVNSETVGAGNEVINNDTPIVISRVDSATEELQRRAEFHSHLSHDEDGTEARDSNITYPIGEFEKAKSDIINATTTLETEEKDSPKNSTAEDIPSFSEWAQKHLEEAEKKEQVNFSSTPTPIVNNTKHAKLRWKNYASTDCGAKVILANSEAQHTWAILVESRDEYVLNPCNSRIWFIVELCEAIQLKKIDLVNYELFSSSPKDFIISVSDRFPTRDWSVVGHFTAKDERDVQTFYVNTEQSFGKYVKVEIKSHYGSEHYCPLSLFRAYGMSVFEALQKDDPAHQQPIEDDDDDDEVLDSHSPQDTSGNLLSTATDAVLSMVKKAAQVLGNKVNKTSESTQKSNDAKPDSAIIRSCRSPSHYVVCNNCSDTLFGKIFELLSCRQKQIRKLVDIPFIGNALLNSVVCQTFGFDFRDKTASMSKRSGAASVESFFPPSYLGAMCNALAITQNKVLYNISHQYANTTENMSNENLVDIDVNPPEIVPAIRDISKEALGEIIINEPTDPLNVEKSDINSKSSCSTDTTYTSQIKPSKSLAIDLSVRQELNTASSDDAGQISQSIEAEQTGVPPVYPPIVVDASTEVPIETDLTSNGNGDENVDGMISEVGAPSVISTPAGAGNMQGQKESVFLRLSNRIKALERNMSLSGQYLEELSKRYKKQVEEMQRFLEKTEQTLNEVTTKEEERHKQLEEKLDSLTRAMENLSAERDTWQTTSYWMFFAFGFLCVVHYFNRRYSSARSAEGGGGKPVEIQRRNSVDILVRAAPKKKTRRPSDQALKIVASAAGDQDKSRKRKKKISNPGDVGEEKFTPSCTSSKIWSKPSDADWVEGRGRIIEGIPFVLDEIDSSTLEPLPSPGGTELSVIEPPTYVKTATTFRLGRSSFRNGKVAILDGRQSSPVPSVNGSISSTNDLTPKKEKKGFKKLFKKVF